MKKKENRKQVKMDRKKDRKKRKMKKRHHDTKDSMKYTQTVNNEIKLTVEPIKKGRKIKNLDRKKNVYDR